MKKWIAVIPVAALILGGATACQKKDTNKEYSKADTGTTAAETRTFPGSAPPTPPSARMNEPATGTRGDTGSQAEASATNGEKVLTGKMDVQDEDARTFIIEGNAQTYVAPAQIDLSSLDGEQVTVRLDPNGRVATIAKASDRES